MSATVEGDAVQRAITAFAQHKTTGPYCPDGQYNSAAQTIADTIRETCCVYGTNRRHWPRAVLTAAAPFEPLAQLALGGTEARRVYARRPPASALHPHNVRTHRLHNPNAGIDWRPVVAMDDLAIPNYGEIR